ncbi:hypothetical protein B0H15DRAFT_832331 [Mycena belliarum]|uniref:Fe2OG dioxygenase domain-containing protein n=1 Tax=Mycena belliarum TaxID=1033014 RepID=A0AAD6U8J2_9AGAR|nr:hypothetical protein B0H15DRAFT_832331 [Mycena belliae]
MTQPPTEAGSAQIALADAKTIADHLKTLREALEGDVPYTGGVHPVKLEDLAVYYKTDEVRNARVIDFANAPEAHLAEIAAACQPATFGVAQQDVLDETYRKAGKMDLGKFSACLDVAASGLLDTISPDLLEGQNAAQGKIIRAEMYKLNVYGPGSFFKAHKDTPRSEDMIGSLVIVFPTAHKGGELTLSHGGTTWTFDSAAELAARSPASGHAVAYVAFFSDVTHAVEPVREGYRVTLTYNLFLVDRPTRASAAAAGQRIPPAPERTFEDALRTLLADATFLPAGGLLAFGLAHQYPMPTPPKNVYNRETRKFEMDPKHLRLGVPEAHSLKPVLQTLKGSDARIRTVAEHVGLATHVKILYNSGAKCEAPGHDVLLDHVVNVEDADADEDTGLRDDIERKGVIIQRGEERTAKLRSKLSYEDRDQTGAVAVHWVTPGPRSLPYNFVRLLVKKSAILP